MENKGIGVSNEAERSSKKILKTLKSLAVRRLLGALCRAVLVTGWREEKPLF